MWIVAKYKSRELKFLKKNLIETLGANLKFYIPKIKYQKFYKYKLKNFEKVILENYLICYHPNFQDKKFVNGLKYMKGLGYFLTGCYEGQKEIVQFIDYCKSFEDSDGYLKPDFFELYKSRKCKFISGPFTDMMFEIISNQKNKLKVLIGNLTTTINKKSGYLYSPV